MSVVVGELAAKLLGGRVHRGARRSNRSARSETRHHIQVMTAAITSFSRVRLKRKRPPEIHGVAVRWRVKISAHVQHARRHDADDGKRLSGKLQAFSDDIRIGLEVRSPEAVAQDDHVVVVLVFLFFLEVAPQHWVIPEHAEIFMRDRHSRKVLRPIAQVRSRSRSAYKAELEKTDAR